jgi:hypothetical protein
MPGLELALSEHEVEVLFQKVCGRIALNHTDSGSFGRFSAGYNAGIRLERGKIKLRNDGTVQIKELQVVHDPLTLTVAVEMPPVTVGGFCVIAKPSGGCLLRAPRKTIFAGNPDIAMNLDLGGIITTELSARCSAALKHIPREGIGRWQLFLDPTYVEIDSIGIADTAGPLIDRLLDAAADSLLGFLPDWARDLVRAIVGSFSVLIRKALNIGGDVHEWLANLFGVSLSLFAFVAQQVLKCLAEDHPIFAFDDAFPLLPGQGGTSSLESVLARVTDQKVVINDNELIITAALKAQ